MLVHGAMTSGLQTWDKQRPLADRWTLVIPERRGYAPKPVADRSDFEVDATDLARLLENRPHLVGHSYGAVGDTFAQQVGAERVVIRGKGHVVQRTGEPFNAVLEQFLVTAGAS